MKFTLALFVAATAALAAHFEPRQEASAEDKLKSLGPCKDACSVIQTIGDKANDLGCNAENPSEDCLKELCGNLDASLGCAECQLRNGPFADKFTDDQLEKGKADSRSFCKDKGFNN